MKVRSLIGRDYGQIINPPYAVATAMLANGTAALPEDDVTNVRGRENIKGSPVEDVSTDRMMRATDYPSKRAVRRKRGRAKN